MGNRSTIFAASTLAIALGLAGVGAIEISAMAVAQTVENMENEAQQLTQDGLRLSDQGQQSEALKRHQQALDIVHRIKARKLEGIILNNIGLAFKRLNNYTQALKLYQQAISIYQEVKDEALEGITLNNIANIYKSQGDIPRALDIYQQALKLHRKVKNERSEVVTLLNIAAIYNSPKSEYLKSSDFLKDALTAYYNIPDRKAEDLKIESAIFREIGSVFQNLGHTQKSLTKYNQALEISREVNDREGEGKSLNQIGTLYGSLNEHKHALKFYQESLIIHQEIGDKVGIANVLNNIATSYFNLQQYEKAIEIWRYALFTIRKSGDLTIEGLILNNIWFLKEIPNNSSSLITALSIHRKVKNRPGEATLLTLIATGLTTENKVEPAIVFYKQSVNLYESLRKDIRKLPRETQEIYTSSVAGTYRQLAEALLTQGRVREAQSILELLKVQELQGYGKDYEANTSTIELPLHPLESQALQSFEKTIATNSLTPKTLKTIAQLLTQNRGRIIQEMNNMPIVIGNPKAVLKANPNALLIQNLVINDKLWVLWTNASGNTKAILVPNVTQKQLDETVKTFRDQIGSPYSNLNQLKATSTQLYNWLIPPELQAELKTNPKPQLIFSLDHVTRYIPVAALYDGTQYLAQRYTLSNLITMDSDMGIDPWSIGDPRLSPNGQSPSILALGTTKAYPGFSALPNVSAELEAIVKTNQPERGIYPGTIQLNQAFTAKSLTQNLNAYRVLHIATHGSFNPKSITASYLLLGDGNRLPITDIAALNNLNTTHLVVLSACETGLSGGGQDGTEISGISGYFLRRGAKSVLASLWSVNDASTALLMQQFYTHLSTGTATKAQALQKAQQDFISGKLTAKEAETIARAGGRPYAPGQTPPGSFAHPYFWAPFVLMGNNQ
jgi:CHAT domain-containing protein